VQGSIPKIQKLRMEKRKVEVEINNLKKKIKPLEIKLEELDSLIRECQLDEQSAKNDGFKPSMFG